MKVDALHSADEGVIACRERRLHLLVLFHAEHNWM
jgi:hypothetical protein